MLANWKINSSCRFWLARVLINERGGLFFNFSSTDEKRESVLGYLILTNGMGVISVNLVLANGRIVDHLVNFMPTNKWNWPPFYFGA